MDNFIPKKQKKILVSVRMDIELLNNIDSVATGLNISRNELVVQCIKFALNKIDADYINTKKT